MLKSLGLEPITKSLEWLQPLCIHPGSVTHPTPDARGTVVGGCQKELEPVCKAAVMV